MSDLHALGYYATDKAQIEALDPRVTQQAMVRAQQRAWQAVATVYRALTPGLTETAGRQLATEVMAGLGVVKHWHRPHLRFGPGTALTFDDPLQDDHPLRVGDPVYIDLGPVYHDSLTGLDLEADVGATLHLGLPRDPASAACGQAAKTLFDLGNTHWHAAQPTGAELYRFLAREADRMGYSLRTDVPGHRLSEVPHHRHSVAGISQMHFTPTSGLWILEIQISPKQLAPGQAAFGAFYEDLLLVPEHTG
jgi:hypothetical protein